MCCWVALAQCSFKGYTHSEDSVGYHQGTEKETMPKAAMYTLTWSWEQNSYGLFAQDNKDYSLLQGDGEAWFAWLASHSSLSFQGQHGHLNLQKEVRPRGAEGYWYAYRRQGRRMVKHYLGRSAELTMARLETTAKVLTSEPLPQASPFSKSQKHAVPLQEATESPEEMGNVSRGSETGPAALDLLVPKLQLPRLPSSLVVRQRLLTQIDAGLEGKLTLLSAPAGFGKTTVVSQWLADRRAHGQVLPVAWFSLEESDNDPIRFWRYVMMACQTFQTTISQSALALLYNTEPRPFEARALEAPLTRFLNELSHLPHRGILVLEDYHVITSSQIHETVTFALDHLPATLHLVLTTRVDPPLPLARWRAHHDLCELHAADLRFSQEEMVAFLQQAVPFSLSREVLMHLDVQMEGWVTGLRLVALTLQDRRTKPEVERILATFSGNHRYIVEFFVTEVLSVQPEPLQTFLLQTSILSRLTASLCNMVTGSNESERLLEAVARTNLFLLPLDGAGQWYRYHPLWAEALQHEARLRLGANVLGECWGRASVWYEQHGMFAEAIDAALQAQVFAHAAVLMEQHIGTQQFHELQEHQTLRRWRDTLPDAVLGQHPKLCVRFAIVQLFSSNDQRLPSLAPIEHLLHIAERGFQARDDQGGQGEVLAFRAMLSKLQGKLALAAHLARQALSWLPEQETQWRGDCVSFIGEEARLSGQLHVARQTLLEAQALYETARNRYATRAMRLRIAEVCFLQGELRQAAELYRAVLTMAEEDRSDQAHALLGLAQLSYEWNLLEAASQEAQEARELGKLLADEPLQIHAELLLARVHYIRGERAHAQHLLHALLAGMQQHTSALLYRELLLWQARLQLEAGDLPQAQRWSTTRAIHQETVPLLHHEQEDLMMARLLLAQRESDEALRLLEHRQIAAHQQGRIRSEVEMLILMALSNRAQNREVQATLRLREALDLASAEGYLRLFLDEGEELVTLLRAIYPTVRKERLGRYVHTLLLTGAFPQPEPLALSASESAVAAPRIDLLEPLSPQEQRVLRLLGAGYTNPEIAQALVVSINTVKTQVQSIYRKLNAKDRKEAREVARYLNQP
jgi:LuxR family transcriptional regulator, maltose regulon positive regulatory protein